MSFIYHCPHCQDAINCPDSVSGQICQCPTCKKEITPHPKEGVNSAPRQRKQFEPPMYCLFAQNVAKLLFRWNIFFGCHIFTVFRSDV